MRGGKRCGERVPLQAARDHARRQLRALPPSQRTLELDEPYPVAISDGLRELARRLDAGLRA
jgi:nicotinate phosphoribosyltransferase